MVRKDSPPAPSASRLYDPAKDAARLLGWFGLSVLMVAAPLTGVLSRRALLVLLPVGAAILAAAYFLSVSHAGIKALRHAWLSSIGLAALFLAGWAALSLVWTPFPEDAAPLCLATLVTIAIAVLIVANLPERRPSPTLFLLPAGLAVTSLAVCGLSLFGPASFRGGTEFDPSLVERSVITLTLLVWPAIGALGAFQRWRLSMLLAVLVAGTLAVASAQIAMAVFALSAISFALAVDAPKRAARIVAGISGALIVLAPLLPFALAPLARSIPMVGQSTVAAMTDWRSLIAGEPVRLITGHGLDSARHGVMAGYLPPHTPRSILFEVWYDLGMLGALALAAVFVLGLVAAANAAATVVPALVGGLVATLAIAVFGVATAELWYVTLACLEGIALGLLARASRGERPTIGSREPAVGAGRVPAPTG